MGIVTVDTYMDGSGENAREVKRVKFKLADKCAAPVDLGRHHQLFTERSSWISSAEGSANKWMRDMRHSWLDSRPTVSQKPCQPTDIIRGRAGSRRAARGGDGARPGTSGRPLPGQPENRIFSAPESGGNKAL
jgi:hypothetical protein